MLIIHFFLPKFVHITKGTFHLNFAIVLLIRTRISLMPSAIHLFFQVPAQTWHLKFMKLVEFKQKHLNSTDFIWRLFFFFVVIIIMVVSFNLTDFFFLELIDPLSDDKDEKVMSCYSTKI